MSSFRLYCQICNLLMIKIWMCNATSSFGHARSLAWPVTLSAAGGVSLSSSGNKKGLVQSYYQCISWQTTKLMSMSQGWSFQHGFFPFSGEMFCLPLFGYGFGFYPLFSLSCLGLLIFFIFSPCHYLRRACLVPGYPYLPFLLPLMLNSHALERDVAPW